MTETAGGVSGGGEAPATARTLMEWAEAGRERIRAYQATMQSYDEAYDRSAAVYTAAIAHERDLIDGWETLAASLPTLPDPEG